MSDPFGTLLNVADTTPSANRQRNYDGGYMAVGRKAEEIVMAWLTSRPEILEVEDLRSLKVMRQADVDCGITLMDGLIRLAEIKSDKHLGRSKNFLFEVLRINHTARSDSAITLGWAARSPARWLFLYAPIAHAIHQITMDDYRSALQNYTREMRKETQLSYVETDNIKSTINILIPERFVLSMPSYRLHKLDSPA